MSDSERAIGRLEGKMDIALTEIKELRRDMKALSQWKWRMGGGFAAFLFLFEAASRLLK